MRRRKGKETTDAKESVKFPECCFPEPHRSSSAPPASTSLATLPHLEVPRALEEVRVLRRPVVFDARCESDATRSEHQSILPHRVPTIFANHAPDATGQTAAGGQGWAATHGVLVGHGSASGHPGHGSSVVLSAPAPTFSGVLSATPSTALLCSSVASAPTVEVALTDATVAIVAPTATPTTTAVHHVLHDAAGSDMVASSYSCLKTQLPFPFAGVRPLVRRRRVASSTIRISREMADASPAAPAGGALVVWDFDWSMINENSDTYVVEHSNAEVYARMRSLRASMPWTALMDSSFAELHRVGVTRPAIEALLARIPVFDEVPVLIRELAAAGVRQWIVSDANTELIRIILESHGLADCFETVVTNPAVWTEDGRLSVSYVIELRGRWGLHTGKSGREPDNDSSCFAGPFTRPPCHRTRAQGVQ